jgi:hypothetical protein
MYQLAAIGQISIIGGFQFKAGVEINFEVLLYASKYTLAIQISCFDLEHCI